MNAVQLQEQVMAGGVYCVGTYLSGRADTISIRDKTTRERRSAVVVRETIITDTEPVIISTWLPDGKTAEGWKPGFKKGQRIVVKVLGMESANGIPVLKGIPEPLV